MSRNGPIWHAIAPIYGASTMIIMDMLPWTAQIRYHHQALQYATKVMSPLIGIIGLHLGTIATTGTPTMIIKMDTGTVIPDLTHVMPDIGVQVCHDSHWSHSRSFHKPSHHSFSHHGSSSSYSYCCDPPHCRSSSHRHFPRMTADPNNTNPTDNITTQAQGSSSSSKMTPSATQGQKTQAGHH